MNRSGITLERAARTAGYLLLGALSTAAVALASLYASRPVQTLVYDLVYLRVGPSEATEAAILTHVLAVGAVAISVPLVLGDYLSDRLAHRRAVAAAVAATAGLVSLFLLVALGGFAAFLTALGALVAAALGVPLLLRYRYGVGSGAIPAFVGGLPVLALLLLLAGFGLGWGWGYVVTAQEVPAPSVGGSDAPTFDDVPAVRDDLFASANCEVDPDDRRVCRLSLRGYEYETEAVRFLARHGVRCPYQNAPAAERAEDFLARHEGTYYRVSCEAHGD